MPQPPFVTPKWLIGGDLFSGPVEVISIGGIDTDVEGKVKSSKGFVDRLPFRFTVEYLRGTTVKTALDGRRHTLPVYDQITVKVWSSAAPDVNVGDYVRIKHPMVGAVDRNLYVQCLDLVKVDQSKAVES